MVPEPDWGTPTSFISEMSSQIATSVQATQLALRGYVFNKWYIKSAPGAESFCKYIGAPLSPDGVGNTVYVVPPGGDAPEVSGYARNRIYYWPDVEISSS